MGCGWKMGLCVDLYPPPPLSKLRCRIRDNELRDFPESFRRVMTIVDLWLSYGFVQATAGVGAILIPYLI